MTKLLMALLASTIALTAIAQAPAPALATRPSAATPITATYAAAPKVAVDTQKAANTTFDSTTKAEKKAKEKAKKKAKKKPGPELTTTK